ncbi:hypothetical protein HJG60_012239 [Phyllostomus discolor]|uniref:Uncharacterized protein n=1 Tax=Phyllostomus discolor TaxID=89673 RepID=A0A833Z808_9CHIR|nr:hypothetical protein HJG60_012239 [Phyllostomus discolor]
MRQLGGTSRASCALYPARVPASWNLGSMTSPQEKPPRSIQAPRDCGVSIRWPGSSQDFPHHPENAWPSRWRGTVEDQRLRETHLPRSRGISLPFLGISC